MTFHVCLAPAVVSGYMPDFLWIYWVGPFLAALFHSVIFYVAPPEHNDEGCFSPPLVREVVTDKDQEATDADQKQDPSERRVVGLGDGVELHVGDA